jgi:hypothetical protein
MEKIDSPVLLKIYGILSCTQYNEMMTDDTIIISTVESRRERKE